MRCALRGESALQTFSNTLFDLYDLAVKADPEQFADDAIMLLRGLVRYDGALFGVGYGNAGQGREYVADHAAACRPHAKAQHFPIAAPALEFSHHAKAWHVRELECATDLQALYDFAQARHAQCLSMYAESPQKNRLPRWLVLYRSDSERFGAEDRMLLDIFGRHLMQAISINLYSALVDIEPMRTPRALAFVNAVGAIEVADKRMTDLLKLEWPFFNDGNFPPHVVAALMKEGAYRGKRIDIEAFQKHGYMVCVARAVPLLKTLAPSELNVAHRFASGMTHKEIAAHLKVSPHTVRNQLAHVYQKLGVHGKAELARLLSSS